MVQRLGSKNHTARIARRVGEGTEGMQLVRNDISARSGSPSELTAKGLKYRGGKTSVMSEGQHRRRPNVRRDWTTVRAGRGVLGLKLTPLFRGQVLCPRPWVGGTIWVAALAYEGACVII
jgi:hypothetical protein